MNEAQFSHKEPSLGLTKASGKKSIKSIENDKSSNPSIEIDVHFAAIRKMQMLQKNIFVNLAGYGYNFKITISDPWLTKNNHVRADLEADGEGFRI